MIRSRTAFAFAALAVAAGTARAGDAVEALEARALKDRAHPRALAELLRLNEKRDWADLSTLRAFYAKLASDGSAHGEVRALARQLALETAFALGDVDGARAEADALGVVRAWAVAGPFDNDGRAGFDTAFPPEKGPLDYAAAWPGKEHEARWRELPFEPTFGYVELTSLLQPHKQIAFYAATVIASPKAQPVWLAYGASGATKLWVNGALVRADAAQHPARFDQAFAAVTLEKGDNLVLLKVAGGDVRPGLKLRVAAVGGAPLRGLAASRPKAGALLVDPKAPDGTAKAHVDDALTALAKAALASGATADAAEDEAIVLASRRPFDEKERAHYDAQQRAALRDPKSAELLLRKAAYQEEDTNDKRQAIEAAVEAAPKDVAALVALARVYLDRDEPFRAAPYVDRAAALEQSVPVLLLVARLHEAMSLGARAIEERLALAAKFPRSFEAQKQAGLALRRLGRQDDAAAQLAVALKLRGGDVETRSSLTSLRVDEARLDDALALLADAARLAPGDASYPSRMAELLSANGRALDAEKRYAEALKLAPDDADAWEHRGRHRLRLADADGAVDDFTRALGLRPQNPHLRELVRELRPEKSYAAPYLADAAALAKKPAPASRDADADAISLADVAVTRVFPNGLASRTRQSVVKVLTQRGVEEWRAQGVRYTPGNQELHVEQARLFKPDGSVIETHGENDHSLSEPWYGIYYDYRERVLSFPQLQPGDVVEVTSRLDDAGEDNYFADYFGDLAFLQSTEPKARAEYTLIGPPGRAFYATVTGPVALAHTEATQPDGTTVSRWTATDVPKIVSEPGMPGWSEIATFVHVSTYKDWASVGDFYWGLVKDQLHVTDEVKKAALEAVKGVSELDEQARIRAVYDYVISHTRYVGLEFGIHGFKPYKVAQVLSRSFGDCKDKASLMHSMLDALGIDSRLALVRMKHLGAIPANPASLAVFNHAILYVPKYALFLDGTAEYHGSRELPGDDVGAAALIIEPGGKSRFVTIEGKGSDENATTSRFTISLSGDGAAELSGETLVSGLGAPDYRRGYESKDNRKERFEQSYSKAFPGLRCTKFEMSDPAALESTVTTAFAASVPGFAAADGPALRFTPFGQAPRYVESYAPLSKRGHAVVLAYPWKNRFAYEVSLPAAFGHATLPEPAHAETPFGSYRIAYRLDGARVVAEGEVQLTAARVEPDRYADFRAFLAGLDAALLRKVTLSPGNETASK